MKKIIALLFFLSVSAAKAQVTFGSLQEVFDYADKNAVSIRKARIDEQISHSQSQAARTSLLPSVNASAAFNDNITLQPTLVPAALFNPAAPEGTFNEYTFGRRYIYNTGVQASWNVLDFQKWFEIQTAGAREKASQAATVKIKYDTYNQLAQLYYSILLTEKYILIGRENVQATGSICETTQDKFRQGIFAEENFNRANMQLIQAASDLRNREYSLSQLYNQLQAELNIPGSVRLTEQLVTRPAPDLISLKQHPDVLLQETQLALAEAQLRQVKTAGYPSLTIGYQYNYNWATDRMFDFTSTNTLPQQFLAVKLSIPVFNGFAVREKTRQSKLTLNQEQILLENRNLSAAKEDEILHLQYRQAEEQLQAQQEILSLQQSNDRHTANRYQSGIIGADERLDKFGDLLSAQSRYMQSLSDYYISYYKIHIRASTGN